MKRWGILKKNIQARWRSNLWIVSSVFGLLLCILHWSGHISIDSWLVAGPYLVVHFALLLLSKKITQREIEPVNLLGQEDKGTVSLEASFIVDTESGYGCSNGFGGPGEITSIKRG